MVGPSIARVPMYFLFNVPFLLIFSRLNIYFRPVNIREQVNIRVSRSRAIIRLVILCMFYRRLHFFRSRLPIIETRVNSSSVRSVHFCIRRTIPRVFCLFLCSHSQFIKDCTSQMSFFFRSNVVLVPMFKN